MAAKRKSAPKSSPDKPLFALLKQVPQHGWTDAALRATCNKTISLADLMQAFPAGIPDALAAFADYAEHEMLTRLGKHKLIQMRVRDRVATGVWTWIEVMAPHREAVAAALRSGWQPMHTIVGIRAIKKLCDVIWIEAGDTATDYNRYTKRGLLALVFATTLIFWLQDRSKGYADTRAFLSARIDNAMQVGKATAQIKNLKTVIASAAKQSRIF
jgi:ubiquinone biosynthesis protein COQ9